MENGHLSPSIDIVQRLMKVFAVSADQLLNDDENSVVDIQNHEFNEQLALINQLDEEKAKATLQNTELLQRFKEVENLPERERSVILEVLSAYLRDFRTKQSYLF